MQTFSRDLSFLSAPLIESRAPLPSIDGNEISLLKLLPQLYYTPTKHQRARAINLTIGKHPAKCELYVCFSQFRFRRKITISQALSSIPPFQFVRNHFVPYVRVFAFEIHKSSAHLLHSRIVFRTESADNYGRFVFVAAQKTIKTARVLCVCKVNETVSSEKATSTSKC